MGTPDRWFGKPTKPLGQRLSRVSAIVLIAFTAVLLQCSLSNTNG